MSVMEGDSQVMQVIATGYVSRGVRFIQINFKI